MRARNSIKSYAGLFGEELVNEYFLMPLEHMALQIHQKPSQLTSASDTGPWEHDDTICKFRSSEKRSQS